MGFQWEIMMRSNMDPHGIRLRVQCPQSLGPLIPSCPAGRQMSSGAGQGSVQHVVSDAVQLDGSATRWLEVSYRF